jgi:putative transposase
VLLPSQVRLLATPPDAGAIGRVMQFIGRRYVPYLNHKTRRTGALWDRRYRSTLVGPGIHLLDAMRYIERQAVVEGLAATPEQWRWSSHGHHVGREQQAFVNDHPRYWSLSDTPFERQAAYRSLADTPLDPAARAQIETMVDRGWILGEAAFVAAVEGELNRRGGPLRRGRPRKSALDVSPIKKSANGPDG